jgi:hypothetical protein
MRKLISEKRNNGTWKVGEVGGERDGKMADNEYQSQEKL